MKLHKELQEGMAEGLEQLPEFMKLARRQQWSEAIASGPRTIPNVSVSGSREVTPSVVPSV